MGRARAWWINFSNIVNRHLDLVICFKRWFTFFIIVNCPEDFKARTNQAFRETSSTAEKVDEFRCLFHYPDFLPAKTNKVTFKSDLSFYTIYFDSSSFSSIFLKAFSPSLKEMGLVMTSFSLCILSSGHSCN